MILNKPWHRAWCDFFNLYVVGICNFGQHPAIGARIGADKADGLALIVILKHVAAEECINGVAHKTIDVVLVELVHQESGIDTQRVARKRMVVDCRHYLAGRQIDILEKVVDKLRRSNVLQAVAEKSLADIRGAALVAKNIAERAHILHYRAAVVIARVGAAAENTGYARLVDQQPAGCPAKVALDGDRSLELRNKRRLDNLLLFRTRTAGSIEMDSLPATLEKRLRKFKTDAVADVAAGVEKRIQAFCKSMFHHGCAVDQCPFCT